MTHCSGRIEAAAFLLFGATHLHRVTTRRIAGAAARALRKPTLIKRGPAEPADGRWKFAIDLIKGALRGVP